MTSAYLPTGKQWIAVVGLMLIVAAAMSAAWWISVTSMSATTPVEPPRDAWAELLAGGDAVAGEALFFDANGPRCGDCHLAKNRGSNLGPNLMLAGRSPLAQLVQAILDPNAQLTNRYESVAVVTNAGKTFAGRIVPTPDIQKITLRLDDGATVSILRSDAAEMRAFSAMPDNYAASLSLQQLRDVVAFLKAQTIDPRAFLRGEVGRPPTKLKSP